MSLLTDNSRARSTSARTASPKKAKAANFAIFSRVCASSVPKLRRARKYLRRRLLRSLLPKTLRFCWQNSRPCGFGRRAFLFVLHSCQFKKRSPCPARRAEHTSPPRILSAASNGGSVPETDAKTVLPFRAAGTPALPHRHCVRPEEKGRPCDFGTNVPLSALPHRNPTGRRTCLRNRSLRCNSRFHRQRLARVRFAFSPVIPLEVYPRRSFLR